MKTVEHLIETGLGQTQKTVSWKGRQGACPYPAGAAVSIASRSRRLPPVDEAFVIEDNLMVTMASDVVANAVLAV